MLSFEDCLALCHLTEEEIAAIAEHEHIPEINALEYGEYLIRTPDGEHHIKAMIVDDIRRAETTGHLQHAESLRSVLKHFLLTHPQLQKTKDLEEE